MANGFWRFRLNSEEFHNFCWIAKWCTEIHLLFFYQWWNKYVCFCKAWLCCTPNKFCEIQRFLTNIWDKLSRTGIRSSRFWSQSIFPASWCLITYCWQSQYFQTKKFHPLKFVFWPICGHFLTKNLNIHQRYAIHSKLKRTPGNFFLTPFKSHWKEVFKTPFLY